MNTIKHLEYTYNGRRAILDTCEIAPGKFETMLMRKDGTEIDCRISYTEAASEARSTQAAYRQVRQAPRRSAQGVRDWQSRSRTSRGRRHL